MQTPPTSIQTAVREYVLKHGDYAASRAFGVARQTVAKLAAGLPVHRVTLIAVAVALGVDPKTVITSSKE